MQARTIHSASAATVTTHSPMRATISGVNELPSMMPSTTIMTERNSGGMRVLSPASVAIVTNVIEPSIHGSGSVRLLNR